MISFIWHLDADKTNQLCGMVIWGKKSLGGGKVLILFIDGLHTYQNLSS
jgi:hypothetical protein